MFEQKRPLANRSLWVRWQWVLDFVQFLHRRISYQHIAGLAATHVSDMILEELRPVWSGWWHYDVRHFRPLIWA